MRTALVKPTPHLRMLRSSSFIILTELLHSPYHLFTLSLYTIFKVKLGCEHFFFL